MKKVIIPNAELKTAIKLIRNIVDKNALIPVLQNVKMSVVAPNQMTIISTDMDTTIVTTVGCQSDENLEFLFPFNILESASTLNKDVDMEICIHDKGAYIKGANDKYDVGVAEDISLFPKLPTFDNTEIETSIESSEFIKALQSALATTSRDTLRPAMTKVLLDVEATKMTVVSTNAHSLFTHKFDHVTNKTVQLLIGDKMIKGIADFQKMDIKSNGNHISISNGTTSVIAKDVDARFPLYQSVIPTNEPNLELNVLEFKTALQKASITVNTTTLEVDMKLKAKEGVIIISSHNIDHAQATEVEIAASYTGPVESIKFNGRLMQTLLGQIPYEKIHLSIIAPNRAILLSSEENTDYLALIMPCM